MEQFIEYLFNTLEHDGTVKNNPESIINLIENSKLRIQNTIRGGTNINYKEKYLKYKAKYQELKKARGGGAISGFLVETVASVFMIGLFALASTSVIVLSVLDIDDDVIEDSFFVKTFKEADTYLDKKIKEIKYSGGALYSIPSDVQKDINNYFMMNKSNNDFKTVFSKVNSPFIQKFHETDMVKFNAELKALLPKIEATKKIQGNNKYYELQKIVTEYNSIANKVNIVVRAVYRGFHNVYKDNKEAMDFIKQVMEEIVIKRVDIMPQNKQK
jgi:hypothetical protein